MRINEHILIRCRNIFEFFGVKTNEKIKILKALLKEAEEEKAKEPPEIDPRQIDMFEDKK